MTHPQDHTAALIAALQRIVKWHDEFPDTGMTYPDGTPMSYGAAYGSNGQRDYMRKVASDALEAFAAAQQTTCCTACHGAGKIGTPGRHCEFCSGSGSASPAVQGDERAEARGRNIYYEGRFDDESEEMHDSRKLWAADLKAALSRQPSAEDAERLHTFLNAAAGEGVEFDGVAADSLYIALYPERYAAAVASIDTGAHDRAQRAAAQGANDGR